MIRPAILGMAMAALLCGQAAGQTKAGADRPGELAGSPARGSAFATRECSGCHSVTRDGVSPRMDAPPFGEINRKYADYRLDWELETVASVGHYAMPPKAMTALQIADVTAYIRSLDNSGSPRKQRP